MNFLKSRDSRIYNTQAPINAFDLIYDEWPP